MSPLAPLTEVRSPETASGAECRVRERHACGLDTSCQPIAARADRDCLWPATLRDISVRGIGLVLRRRFERGTGLAIEIPGTDGQSTDTLLAKVVRVSGNPDGTWLLGCQFVSELSDDELNALLRQAQSQHSSGENENAAGGESRAATEEPETDRPDASRSVLIPGVWFEGTAGSGQEGRRVVRRLYLSASWPLAPETCLWVKVANRPRQPPAFKIRVHSCTRGEDGWTLNYTFVDAPSEAVLRLFGYSPS